MKHNIIILASLLGFVFACKTNNEPSKNNELSESVFNFKKIENAVLYAGSLHRLDSFPTRHITPRAVDVWLPKNYSKENQFAVLYMHDGQNLFDSTTTWNKQEWKVDEWASKLVNEGKTKPFIIVGIHNIPQIRWQDLYPQKTFNYLDQNVKDSILNEVLKAEKNIEFNGDNYLAFLVKDLKPAIDKTFSTLPDTANTFVMGSSMGGLMSMYAICEYPEVFGGAACLSTHWPGGTPKENNPLPNSIFTYMEANLPDSKSHKIYFDYGNKTLDAYYPKYAPTVTKILTAKGYSDTNFKNLMFEGTDHSENSWNKRLNIPLTFLLSMTND